MTRGKLFKKGLFARLLIIYHLVILPIILMGLYLYFWSYNNASEEISRQTQNQLNNYLTSLSQEIGWMESQQYGLLHDHRLQPLTLTWEQISSVERKEHVNHFIERLRSIQGTSAYISDISIYMPTVGQVMSSSQSLRALDADFHDRFQNVEENRIFTDTSTQAIKYSVSNLSRDIDGIPSVFVEIELDNQKLTESLDLVNIHEGSGMFVLGRDQRVLWHSNDASYDILSAYLASQSLDLSQENPTNALVNVNDVNYQINFAHLDGHAFTLVNYLPEEVFTEPLAVFRQWVFVFVLLTLLAIGVYGYTTYRFVHQPLLTLTDAFKDVEVGNLDRRIEEKVTGEFGYIFNRFNKMVRRLDALVERDYKQKLMVQKAELKQLQSQINPHFLYNSLFILNSLARTEDTERIESFTMMLGEYFKFITRNENNSVDLKSEIKHARMYTEIQNMRFSRRIKVEFNELPPKFHTLKVPKLIVQPIIENAYKYSLEKKVEDGLLIVSFVETDAGLSIVVEDNGEELYDTDLARLENDMAHDRENKELSGLMNIHRRIVLTFGQASGLFFSRSEHGGLRVELKLPILNEED